ncbi:hypothetical protein RJT34_14735 [Clitoria ternatea]|uniref:Transcription factor GTE1 n=1 Tax=Clitoria ternatea TaxID=43366 RepID=A0AAN9JRF9_CLITE
MDPIFRDAASSHITEDDLNRFRYSVYGISNQVQQLEKQVAEVEQFYHSTSVQVNNAKGRERHLASTKKPPHGSSSGEANRSNTMHEMTQHKWAWPFKEPVDVEGLGLHDYYEIIKKPMDFSTIKRKMDAKDGSGYKNVREMYSDVRLVFKNAMKYNDEKNDVHIMAKTLLEKFEKKWLQLLPKVAQAENEQLKEEAHMQLESQLAQEATYANMARNISDTLSEVDFNLTNLKALVVQKCRKLSTSERLKLANSFPKLSSENLTRALRIIHEDDPNFKHNAKDVHLDLDSQSDYTVWRLNLFVKNALVDPNN